MNADEKDADEIIEMANKAALPDQQKQVQENIHFQVKNVSRLMDDILRPDLENDANSSNSASGFQNNTRRSGLGLAIGRTASIQQPVVPASRPLTRLELSERLKDHIGYSLNIKPSQIPHKEAGNGLFITGEADVGAVVAFYPGVIYSPAYYRHIPGYPRVDSSNSYLITRYDGMIINAQPWGVGGEARERWNGFYLPEQSPDPSGDMKKSSDLIWRMLSKPLESGRRGNSGEVLERRNPLAFGHFANHPGKGMEPNVMVCPYDFPVSEQDVRIYVPNLVFGGEESVKMKRFGSFWFKSGGSGDSEAGGPVIRTLVLVATRALGDEEVFLNYRLSNSKRRPSWYSPVNEEEDRRRWS
ncbi:uncharacterized protein M6B38_265445 [Iris pallida]|nr:uncharacterized protein M6B38_265445 [Iris pallida]